MVGVLLVSRDTAWALAVARAPGQESSAPSVILLDSAAAAARSSHPCAEAIQAAIEAGTTVVVHDEAVQRRGMESADLVDGLKTVDLDEIADLIADASGTVMWL